MRLLGWDHEGRGPICAVAVIAAIFWLHRTSLAYDWRRILCITTAFVVGFQAIANLTAVEELVCAVFPRTGRMGGGSGSKG